MGLNKWYNGLPSWSKGVVSILGIAIVGVVTYDIIRNAKRASELKKANEASKQADDELRKLKSMGISPSFTPTQYTLFAQKLVEALNGCGHDMKAVKSIFSSMKNKADVLSLISSFGVQFYRPCPATQPISYSKYLLNSEAFGGALQTWLQYDLSASEISDLNKILEKNKIDIKF